MPQAYPKTVEIAAPKSSLTPCILEDDPVQLDALAALIADLGYEPVPTSDPEEALKTVRHGRCRLKRDEDGGRSDPANGEAANGSADQDAGENDDALA